MRGVFWSINQYLSEAQGTRSAKEREERLTDDSLLRQRLEAEQKSTECRQHCRDQLSSLLVALRSVPNNETGSKQLEELRHQYNAIIANIPSDMEPSLAGLKTAFNEEYGKRDEAISHDRQLREAARAKEQKTEQTEQLGMFYLIYLELKFCSQHFSNFDDATATARQVSKKREENFSAEEITSVWSRTAENFAKFEPILKATATDQLYLECSRLSNLLAGLLMSDPAQSPNSKELPKKNF
jgi:hypothetical protein